MRKMVFSIMAIAMMIGTNAVASMSYECWAYKNGSPWKMVHVSANNKSQAIDLAWDKFKSLDINPQKVNCK